MAAGVLVSCSDDVDTGMAYLNGASKTPIAVQTNLSAAPVTRAFDKTFELNDQLFAYIEAGKMVGGDFVYEGQFLWKGNFTLARQITTSSEADKGNITSTTEDSDLSPIIYWDDFSSVEYDLRATDVERGIRLKYGYCFNGGQTNAKSIDEEAGTLLWTVNPDQSLTDGNGDAVNMKTSDLLYAKKQEMITYHSDINARGTLYMPYTHAMSKVTINVTAGDGFSGDKGNFDTSVLTMNNVQVVADVNAPEGTTTIPESIPEDILSAIRTTVPEVSTSGKSPVKAFRKEKTNTIVTYQTIIAPTNLSAGTILATITDIDGNDYNIPVTTGILEAWKAEDKMVETEETIDNGTAQAKPSTNSLCTSGSFLNLSQSSSGSFLNLPETTTRSTTILPGKGYITKPGIHYILNVRVDKQKITIRATITDWDKVTATGDAEINFAGDIKDKDAIAAELQDGGFDIYKSATNTAFTTKSTTATYAAGKWTYTPTIYWAGQSDNSYFRAVSPAGASSSELSQGIDLIWGTSGNDAIAPRTGDVELKFKHLMSKLCVNLETSDDPAKQVNLTGAKIKITNLTKQGTYSIVDATVSAGAPAKVMLENKASGFKEPVIPQTIADDARLIITLADETTYSLQLNECIETLSGTAIEEWLTGKKYTYTIHLEKGKITFRAMVKEWEETNGGGNANLEWD